MPCNRPAALYIMLPGPTSISLFSANTAAGGAGDAEVPPALTTLSGRPEKDPRGDEVARRRAAVGVRVGCRPEHGARDRRGCNGGFQNAQRLRGSAIIELEIQV